MLVEDALGEMLAHGLDPLSLAHSEDFASALTALDVERFRGLDIALILGCEAGAPLFIDMQGAAIFLNLPILSRMDPVVHVYADFLVKFLGSACSNLLLRLDFNSVDEFSSKQLKTEIVVSLHKAILLLHFFYRKHVPSDSFEALFEAPTLQIGHDVCLFARPGNVELRALRVILKYPNNLAELCRDIMANINSEEYMYRPSTSNEVDLSDRGHVIRQLITNAGMYASDAMSLDESLRKWANLYISGLLGSHEIFLRWDYSLHAHAVRLAAMEAGLTFSGRKKVKIAGIQHLYDQLAGKKVLLLSPFSSACLHSVHSGAIKNLWKGYMVPDFELFSINAEITTYPNRPHTSWSETFNAACRNLDAVLSNAKIDLVLGACGCYGVPCMDYCVKRYNIPAIYYGNFTHALFGIRLKDFEALMPEANEANWVDPFIESQKMPKYIERIDNGRYLQA